MSVVRRPTGYFRESGFPFQPAQNGRVVFRRNDIKRWVRLCTGYEYEMWISRWEASDKSSSCVFDPMRQNPPDEPKTLLYVALYRVGGVETIVRRTDGFPYIAHSRAAARRWPAEVREYADAVAEFSVASRAAEEDFRDPETEAARVILPRLMRAGETRYLLVSGVVFGLNAGARCPLVAPAGWATWRTLRPTIDRGFPDTIWTTWSGRTDLDRFVLTPPDSVLSPGGEAPTRPGDPVPG